MKHNFRFESSSHYFLLFVFILYAIALCSGCQSGGTSLSDTASSEKDRSEPVSRDSATESGRIAKKQTGSPSSGQGKPDVSPSPQPRLSDFIIPEGKTLEERFLPPKDFVRVPAKENSFAAFLRNYKLKPDQSPVLLYNGKEKPGQNSHAAVFAMHLSDRDLQQCADSVMRIYAEYFYQTGQTDRIKFHFVDGFLCDYEHWKQGFRVSFQGNKASWTQTAKPGNSKESLENYLNIVFAYSSTLSLEEESSPANLDGIKAGDIFIKAGSPGHVVLVADLCENSEGSKAFLLAQGFMPAQEFHIIKNPAHPENPWYYTDEITFPFQTESYAFPKDSFMRPSY